MSSLDLPTSAVVPLVLSPPRADAAKLLRCPRCGNWVDSLVCGHCGRGLPAWQKKLYATVRKLARTGGTRTETDRKGGDGTANDGGTDNGGASTPRWLFDRCSQLALEACGEPITLDVAVAEWNHKCERYFTEQQDGLKQTWDAGAAWCNAPYSAAVIERFVRKAIDAAARHGTTTVCLLPWWNYPYMDLCERHGRVHRICSPVSFQRQDGTSFVMNNRYSTTQLVVVMFGPAIQPGFGAPIRNGDTPGKTVETEEDHGGITARALAGDGDCRREDDAYYTPQWAIDAILTVEQFPGLTWEPAEGDGRIVKALRQAGYEVFGSDLATGTDFLTDTRDVDNVVTNPPWKLKTRFIERAKECARGKVALLLPLSALSGAARRPLFEDSAFPLRTVYVFDRRLDFDPEGNGSSTITGGWFVWERGYQGEPVLRWI